MNLAIISFTSSGKIIAEKLKASLEKRTNRDIDYTVDTIDKNTFEDKIKVHMEAIFQNYDGIVFVSSTGIAVRYIAPFIVSKTTDPAVVVVDDLGKYSISLLSGHIGGANNLAKDIAKSLSSIAVITTSSDLRGIEAVDLFAIRNNLVIESMEDAKVLTAMMIENKKIKLVMDRALDKKLSLNYNNLAGEGEDYQGLIYISSDDRDIESDKPLCKLRVKNLNIGIGCRRGKSFRKIYDFIEYIFERENLSLKCVRSIGSIDIKSDEEGILELAKKLGADLKFFSKEEIELVQDDFQKSDFVKAKVGVSSVCEPAAYLLGENIIVKKCVSNGITIAVSKTE